MAESKSGGEECPESPTTTESSNNSDATDTEREWAQAAQAQFTKGNYVAALTLLSYLQGTRPKDPKVSRLLILSVWYVFFMRLVHYNVLLVSVYYLYIYLLLVVKDIS